MFRGGAKITDVTIIGQDDAVFTFAQGEIKTVKGRAAAEIEVNALPASGPSSAIGFDFNGVLKMITISGVLFETSSSRVNTSSVTTILEQKQWLEKQLNGLQLPKGFTSNYDSQSFNGTSFVATKVFKGLFEWSETEGSPEALPITITLLVGE